MSFEPGVPSTKAAIEAALDSTSVPSAPAKRIAPSSSPSATTVLLPAAVPRLLPRTRIEPEVLVPRWQTNDIPFWLVVST